MSGYEKTPSYLLFKRRKAYTFRGTTLIDCPKAIRLKPSNAGDAPVWDGSEASSAPVSPPRTTRRLSEEIVQRLLFSVKANTEYIIAVC